MCEISYVGNDLHAMLNFRVKKVEANDGTAVCVSICAFLIQEVDIV